tara:strand:- start:52 stop:1179 length:1128 start_codon:yes stop_codon:yes gene_type:complete
MEVLNILNRINNFMDTKKKLESLNLVVKEYPELDLYLVKYDKNSSDMTHPDVIKCRGLVAKISDNSLVCLPPTKSVSFNNDTDWEDVTVEDFVDGTMINLFFHNNQWLISTRSSVGANCKWSSNKYFYELFSESNQNINFEILDKDIFYTFVLLHPENIIVTHYSHPNLVLVSAGKLINKTYENLDINKLDNYTGLKIKSHTFSSYNDAYDYVSKLNYQNQGLVLKYGKNKEIRSKIRNSNYNYVKLLKGNTNNLKFLYFELLQKNNYKEYLSFFPDKKELFDGFYKEYIGLIKDVFKNYKLYHVYKKIDINKMPYKCRPLCYELHKLYKTIYIPQKKVINFDIVYKYILSLPVPRIIFSLTKSPPLDSLDRLYK